MNTERVDQLTSQIDDLAALADVAGLDVLAQTLEAEAERDVCDVTAIMAFAAAARCGAVGCRLQGRIADAVKMEQWSDELVECAREDDYARAMATLGS